MAYTVVAVNSRVLVHGLEVRYIVVVYIVMAYIIMACTVMAYIIMAPPAAVC